MTTLRNSEPVAAVCDRRGKVAPGTSVIDRRYRKPQRPSAARKLALFFSLVVSLVPLPAQKPAPIEAAPAQNWEMKVFTKEGYRSMIVRGSEVRMAGTNRYDVVDLNITTFTAAQDARVDSILLSPSASFFAKEQRASGEKSVRLIRDDMEITGERWTCLYAERKVSIQQNSRVVFHAALPDILR